MYIKTLHVGGFTLKRINSDNTVTFIPVNITNSDYQAYLAWVNDGNEPVIEEYIPPVVVDEPSTEERLAALELVVSMVFAEDDVNV